MHTDCVKAWQTGNHCSVMASFHQPIGSLERGSFGRRTLNGQTRFGELAGPRVSSGYGRHGPRRPRVAAAGADLQCLCLWLVRWWREVLCLQHINTESRSSAWWNINLPLKQTEICISSSSSEIIVHSLYCRLPLLHLPLSRTVPPFVPLSSRLSWALHPLLFSVYRFDFIVCPHVQTSLSPGRITFPPWRRGSHSWNWILCSCFFFSSFL